MRNILTVNWCLNILRIVLCCLPSSFQMFCLIYIAITKCFKFQSSYFATDPNATKIVDLQTMRATVEGVLSTHYPNYARRVAVQLVPCANFSQSALNTLARWLTFYIIIVHSYYRVVKCKNWLNSMIYDGHVWDSENLSSVNFVTLSTLNVNLFQFISIRRRYALSPVRWCLSSSPDLTDCHRFTPVWGCAESGHDEG